MPKEINHVVEDQVKNIQTENELEEASAADTLRPSGGSGGGTSRSESISKLMKYVAGMSKEDLSSFLEKTLVQVGKEDETVPDTSGKNKNSIDGKGASKPNPTTGGAKSIANAKATANMKMKEDVEELLAGQELNEEFRDKATTLFEAAVNNRVTIEMTKLEEELVEEAEEKLTEAIDDLHEKVSNYLDYCIEKWIEENTLVLESEIRTEISENFIQGLKNLFAENYVDVPEDKVDLVSEQASAIEELSQKLEEAEAERIRLNQLVEEAEKEVAFDELSEDLADTQIEKLRTLSEGIEYSDVDEYVEKLQIIKEQYFNNKESSNEEKDTGLINEEVAGTDPEQEHKEKIVNPEIKSYFDALSRTTKKY
jgi:hypothetical protein